MIACRPAADAFERSRYFGMSKDIYQMDHFMAAFVQSMPGMTDLQAYDIKQSRELPDGRVEVEVTVQPQHVKEVKDFVFVMKRAEIGKHKGSWVTHRLLAADSQWRGVV